MSLIAGERLQADKFFWPPHYPINRGSSFDLTIGGFYKKDGTIIKNNKKETKELGSADYILNPGEMVQVVSNEIFKLPNNVTGHVTYKTTLTKSGIWALTIGIVDPGWDGPLTTILLNYSTEKYPLNINDTYLRVSLIEHDPIYDKLIKRLNGGSGLYNYYNDARYKAINIFPKTF